MSVNYVRLKLNRNSVVIGTKKSEIKIVFFAEKSIVMCSKYNENWKYGCRRIVKRNGIFSFYGLNTLALNVMFILGSKNILPQF